MSTSNQGIHGMASPSVVAPIRLARIAGIRPIRSATRDQGSTETARPSVAAETVSAAREASTPMSAASTGSTPCGE